MRMQATVAAEPQHPTVFQSMPLVTDWAASGPSRRTAVSSTKPDMGLTVLGARFVVTMDNSAVLQLATGRHHTAHRPEVTLQWLSTSQRSPTPSSDEVAEYCDSCLRAWLACSQTSGWWRDRWRRPTLTAAVPLRDCVTNVCEYILARQTDGSSPAAHWVLWTSHLVPVQGVTVEEKEALRQELLMCKQSVLAPRDLEPVSILLQHGEDDKRDHRPTFPSEWDALDVDRVKTLIVDVRFGLQFTLWHDDLHAPVYFDVFQAQQSSFLRRCVELFSHVCHSSPLNTGQAAWLTGDAYMETLATRDPAGFLLTPDLVLYHWFYVRDAPGEYANHMLAALLRYFDEPHAAVHALCDPYRRTTSTMTCTTSPSRPGRMTADFAARPQQVVPYQVVLVDKSHASGGVVDQVVATSVAAPLDPAAQTSGNAGKRRRKRQRQSTSSSSSQTTSAPTVTPQLLPSTSTTTTTSVHGPQLYVPAAINPSLLSEAVFPQRYVRHMHTNRLYQQQTYDNGDKHPARHNVTDQPVVHKPTTAVVRTQELELDLDPVLFGTTAAGSSPTLVGGLRGASLLPHMSVLPQLSAAFSSSSLRGGAHPQVSASSFASSSSSVSGALGEIRRRTPPPPAVRPPISSSSGARARAPGPNRATTTTTAGSAEEKHEPSCIQALNRLASMLSIDMVIPPLDNLDGRGVFDVGNDLSMPSHTLSTIHDTLPTMHDMLPTNDHMPTMHHMPTIHGLPTTMHDRPTMHDRRTTNDTSTMHDVPEGDWDFQ